MISLDIKREITMVDVLVRGVSEEAARWLRIEAERDGRSMNDLTREAIEDKARKSKARREAFWKEVDALRDAIGPMPDNAVDLIRDDRDSR
jgi:plasmid stability protein